MRRLSVPVALGSALSVLASVILVAGPSVGPARADLGELQDQLEQTAAERAAAAAELARIRARERSARERFGDAQREHEAAVAALRGIDDDLERARAELSLAEERLVVMLREVEQAEEDVRGAEEALDARRQQFETRVVAAFKYGQMSLTDVFSSVRDVSDLVVTTTYLNAVVQNDRALVDEMTVLLADLSERRAEAIALRVEAERARDQAVSMENDVARRLEDQRAVAAQVERTRANLERSLQELREDAAALQEHLDELEAAQRQIERMIREARARDVGDTGSGWVRPVDGWLSSGFGNRFHPIHRRNILHAGVDLAARTGTPILASRGGIVIHAGWIRGYGHTVIIDHGNSVTTLYAHMSAYAVAGGEYVAQGARVGDVGMTGTATGPHLHFEVRVGGVPQNPCGYIRC
jgi:murein DD-endopeptidase MepM/ murein hydrolase activator NlpD